MGFVDLWKTNGNIKISTHSSNKDTKTKMRESELRSMSLLNRCATGAAHDQHWSPTHQGGASVPAISQQQKKINKGKRDRAVTCPPTKC